MSDDDLLELFESVARSVAAALAGPGRRDLVPGSASQHYSDLAADAAVVPRLEAAGLGVLSEESGLRHAQRPLLVVVDPLDGSTNAAHGIPWYAVSLCVLDATGPRVAWVENLASGEAFHAVRGSGAWRGSERLHPSAVDRLGDAVIGVSGLPERHWGWAQFRAFGAAALDLCNVAAGRLDGFVDCSPDAHGVWDYLGGWLVCQEAGAHVADVKGRDLVVRDPSLRRTPVAAATPALLEALVEARSAMP